MGQFSLRLECMRLTGEIPTSNQINIIKNIYDFMIAYELY